MTKKRESKEDMEAKLQEVMSFMGKRSAEARQKAWGKREFKKRMKEWGKLGGRPKKSGPAKAEQAKERKGKAS